jgi:hypothetical protein
VGALVRGDAAALNSRHGRNENPRSSSSRWPLASCLAYAAAWPRLTVFGPRAGRMEARANGSRGIERLASPGRR